MPRKMARQTLERHAGACCAGSRPYLGSGLLGSPENRYNLPHFRVHPGNPGLRVMRRAFASILAIAAIINIDTKR
jgi:hypothetical protein